VIVATTAAALAAEPSRAEALRAAGVELLALPPAAAGGLDMGALLDELGRRQWTRLLVEGGAAVLRSIVHGGLADELWAFLTPHHAGGLAAGVPRFGVGDVGVGWSPADPPEESLDDDLLLRFRRLVETP
jgi:diaminohydroxyphosphoribosylaminopyrimidine deaminase/5-amino-6-(5-phosphoribosylamino)uracil reductase